MMMEKGALSSVVEGGPAVAYVVRMAARGFDVSVDDLQGDSREQPLVWYRQATMAAVRRLTGLSYPAIGRRFGGRDHTTVMHACERARTAPHLVRATEALCFEVQRQWAIDHGLNVPMRGQEVLAL